MPATVVGASPLRVAKSAADFATQRCLCSYVLLWPWPARMCIVCECEFQDTDFQLQSEDFQFQSLAGGEICGRFRHPKLVSLFLRRCVKLFVCACGTVRGPFARVLCVSVKSRVRILNFGVKVFNSRDRRVAKSAADFATRR